MSTSQVRDADFDLTVDDLVRAMRWRGFGLDGVDVVELHAMALGLRELGARVRRALDEGDRALSTTASGEP